MLNQSLPRWEACCCGSRRKRTMISTRGCTTWAVRSSTGTNGWWPNGYVLAKQWSLGCVIPASWLPLAPGARFTLPRDHSLAHPSTSQISITKSSLSFRFIPMTKCGIIPVTPATQMVKTLLPFHQEEVPLLKLPYRDTDGSANIGPGRRGWLILFPT